MKPINTESSTPYLLRISIAVGAVLVVCVLIAFTRMIWNSRNAHDRPGGHGDVSFAVSPGGDAVVFNAVGDGGRDLYLLDLKTLRTRRIAATPDYEVDPEFAPDGKSVVYAAGKPGDRADHIFLRSLDGKTVKQLTAEDRNDESPAFSPDGSLIAFSRCKTYNWGGLASHWGAGVLCVIRADGTGFRQITADESFEVDPHFSPDGRTILFWYVNRLYTVPADGSQPPSPLGDLRGRDAVYSPDGTSIAFSNGRYAPDCRIFVANADGTNIRKLAYPGDAQPALRGDGCFAPAFAPDGKSVFFFFDTWPDGPTGVLKQRLWEVDIERGNPHEIAGYTLFDDPLDWRSAPPVPTK